MSDQGNQLIHKIVRLPKDEAAFLYFQLESNEGLGFYSTLDQSLKEPYRDIELFGHISLQAEIDHFFSYIGNSINIEIILDEVIQDSRAAVQKFGKRGKKLSNLT